MSVADVGDITKQGGGVKGNIDVDEAKINVKSLRESADKMKQTLDLVKAQMERIGDKDNDQSVAYDSYSDTAIMERFIQYYNEFPKYYNQIQKTADDIEDSAMVMEEE